MSRKPDADAPTKYETPLPSYLEDFFVYYLKYYVEGEELEDWQMQLVDEIADAIVEKIKVQWKSSANTRRMFVPMNPENVWENKAEKVMRLTRRNLATFDKPFMGVLDDFVRETLKNRILPIRDEISSIIIAVNASEEEDSAVQTFCSGDTFYFEDLAQHLVEQEAWQSELYQRIPVIQYVRAREKFILEVIKFEESNHNSSVKNSRISNHNLNAKYRTTAAKTMTESLETVKSMIDEYQGSYQKAFEVKGVVYQHNVEEQEGCEANVKTNFSGYHRDLLVFLNPELDSIEEAVITGPAQELLADPEKYTEPEFNDYTAGIF